MSDEFTWDDLHDATLVAMEVGWPEGSVTIHRLRGLECPRMEPCGPSESINTVVAPTPLPDGDSRRLEIEMQSGDVIKVDAVSFVLTAVPDVEGAVAR